ncbi:hypothetical protein HYW75_01155 [Candidatus Pacearchaeota archaeon]|nr:hypothetical protein [Candidatus Pacearchaeota archaeon]
MEITDIAGDLSKTDLKLRVENTREAFSSNGKPLVVRGYCNNQRANYIVGVGEFPRNPIIYLDQKSEKPIKDYCKINELPKKLKRDSIYLMHLTLDIAYLFPYHNVALLRSTSLAEFDKEMRSGVKTLQDLKYEVIPKPNIYTSNNWNDEMKVRLLHSLRDSNSIACAADERALKILQTIYEYMNFNPDECIFTLAEYITRRKKRDKLSDDSIYKVELEKEEKWEPRKIKRLKSFGARGLLLGGLEGMCTDLNLTRAIGISSNVKTQNGQMHIPMIDFVGKEYNSWPNEEYQSRISEDHTGLVKSLGIPGIFVDSGNSFHFYGFNLLTKEEWQNMMLEIRGKQGVDEFWPDLSLKQGFSMLRITPSRYKLCQPAIYPYSSLDQKKKWDFDSSYNRQSNYDFSQIENETNLIIKITT